MFEKKQGFELSIDDERSILKIRAWGYWDAEVAGKYRNEFKTMVNEMKARGKDWYTLVDVTEFSPQSKKVQNLVKERMELAAECGLKKEARIIRDLPTKWQMTQLARQSDLPRSADFRSEGDAIQWLSNGSLN